MTLIKQNSNFTYVILELLLNFVKYLLKHHYKLLLLYLVRYYKTPFCIFYKQCNRLNYNCINIIFILYKQTTGNLYIYSSNCEDVQNVVYIVKSNIGHYSGGLMSHNRIFVTILTEGHRSLNQAYKIAKVTKSI